MKHLDFLKTPPTGQLLYTDTIFVHSVACLQNISSIRYIRGGIESLSAASVLASPGRPCGFPERALMRGISRTFQIELRALLDKIWVLGDIFQVTVAES